MSQLSLAPTPVEILEKALQEERAACDFYTNLAVNCKVVFLSELLVELRDEEAKHVKMIQAMLSQIKAGTTPKFKH